MRIVRGGMNTNERCRCNAERGSANGNGNGSGAHASNGESYCREFSEHQVKKLKTLHDLEEKCKSKAKMLYERLDEAKLDLANHLNCMTVLTEDEIDEAHVAETYQKLHHARQVARDLDLRVNYLHSKLMEKLTRIIRLQGREITLLNKKYMSQNRMLHKLKIATKKHKTECDGVGTQMSSSCYASSVSTQSDRNNLFRHTTAKKENASDAS